MGKNIEESISGGKSNLMNIGPLRKLKRAFVVKRVLPVLAGGILGYAYYYFIGCSTGSCPIQSNPYFSIAYGAFAGAIFAFPGKKPEKKTNGDFE
ncbi:MAG: DUF6132 family protein [Bacteroidota bacterium]|nr:DUF6132 family protein [Bacteroidota bacterium]MDP4191943.1 DUF6132 family protein [Bacteroidota bacterium]MDP4196906.1 DUF6132 family protein [Bacteroidota bacterium]